MNIMSSNDEMNSSVFGAFDVANSLPAKCMPEHSMRAEDAYTLIEAELLLDGNARQNLATFCQTWDDPQVRRLMDLSIDKNLIDKDEYPQSAQLELRCVRMLAELWNSPDPEKSIGCSTIGSSEACMLAGMAALWRWRDKQKAEGKSFDKPNIVCGPVQICWHKFCRYWGVEMREVPMEKDVYCMTPESMIKLIDDNTIIVMTTFGITFTGAYESTLELSNALDSLEKAGGPNVNIHVDAASGGFISPFLTPDIFFDFRILRVKSISASGHKYGLAPLGCGWVLWREMKDLPKDLCFDVNYLGGSLQTIAINFSRPAGQIIAQYYNLVRLGKSGYRRIHQASFDVALFISAELKKIGHFDFISQGDMRKGMPCICFMIKSEPCLGYSLYDLSDRLRMRGWQVPAYSLPAHMEELVVMRIMVRQGFSMDMASLFMDDFQNAMNFLGKHSAAIPQCESESVSFKHT